MINSRAYASSRARASRSSSPSLTPRAEPAVSTDPDPAAPRKLRQARSVEMQESIAREKVQPKSGSGPTISATTPPSTSVWPLRKPSTKPSAPTER